MLEPALNCAGIKSVVIKEEGKGTAERATPEGHLKGKATHRNLLVQFKDIQRWYNNVQRGSQITADVYRRRLCFLYASRDLSPAELVKRARSDERWACHKCYHDGKIAATKPRSLSLQL